MVGLDSRLPAYRAIDNHVCERVRNFLTRWHNVKGHGFHRFSDDYVSREGGVLRLRRVHIVGPTESYVVKPVGKPGAGNRHVRFDERGRETAPMRLRPSSTLPRASGGSVGAAVPVVEDVRDGCANDIGVILASVAGSVPECGGFSGLGWPTWSG